jgi:hypothetical protein
MNDALTPMARCADNGVTQVPGYTLTVTQQHFAALGIKTYPGVAGNPSWCLRASLCGNFVAPATKLDLFWVKPQGFSLQSPEGAWQNCMQNNCPSTPGCSNIIVPNTGNPAGETLQIQSSNGNCVNGVTVVLRVSPDCMYNTTFVGPLR